MRVLSSMLDQKKMTREAEEGGLERHNDSTIHSGHFMVSFLHDKEREEDYDETTDPVKVEPKQTAYDFQTAQKETANSYQFGPRSTSTLSIDASLTKLFECMTLAYSGKLTSPKWKTFKGLKLKLKDKVRLNNIIWREWHMQYIQQKRPIICQFAAPISDETHSKPEAVVLEGKYWKRRLESVTAEYKKWRLFFKDRLVTFPPDLQLREVATTAELLERVAQQDAFHYVQPNPQTWSQIMEEDLCDMDLTDTLFSTLNQPFAFPNPKEMTQLGNADFIQPGLIQLQPNLEDFMDTLEPFQDLLMGRSQAGSSQFNSCSVSMTTPMQTDSLVQNMGLQSLDEVDLLGDPSTVSMDTTPVSSAMQQSQSNPDLSAMQQSQSAPDLSASAVPQSQPLVPSVINQQNQTTTMLPSISTSRNLLRPAQPLAQSVNQPSLLQQLQQVQRQIQASPVRMEQTLSPLQAPSPQVQQPQLQNMSTLMQGVSAFQAGVPNMQASMQQPQQQTIAPQTILSLLFGNSSTAQPATVAPAPVIQTVAPVQTIQVIPATNLGGYLASLNQQQNASSILSSLINQASVSMATSTVTSQNVTKATNSQGPRRSSTGSIKNLLAGPSTPTGTNKKRDGSFLVPTPPKSTPSRKPRNIVPATTATSTPAVLPGNSQNILAQLLKTGKYPGANLPMKQEPSFTGSSSTYTTTASFTPIRPAVTSTVASTSAVTFTVASSVAVNDFQKNILLQAAKQALGAQTVSTSPTPSPTPSVLQKKVSFSTPDSPSSVKSGSTNEGSPQPPSPKFSVDSPGSSIDPQSPPKPFRPKNDAERQVYKEMRRTVHISAEQKRRCNIKSGFDLLHQLVPALQQNPNAKISKAATLQKTADFCRKLKSERSQMQDEASILKAEIDSLYAAINVCQSQLPATGVPVTRQRVDQMREMLDDYIRNRTEQNWKFWIFSVIIRPLFDSYNNVVSTSSIDELCRTVLAWLDQNCSLVSLRPTVLNSLRHLCTITSILSDPSRVPEQAQQAVAKHSEAGDQQTSGNS